MSELVFTVVARNQASQVFNNVARDSAKMGNAVKDSSRAMSIIGGAARKSAAALKGLAVGVVAVTAGAGALAIKVGKDAVGAATDLNETMSKSATIFGKGNATMVKWADTAAQTLGMSKEAALAGAAQFGNFFDQIGIGGDRAAKMSRQLLRLSADLGSFNNADPAEVMASFQSATRGEYDSLQKFIPTVNAATVEAESLRLTHKKAAKDLTTADKALGLYALANKDAGAAVGDFAKTSGGLANQQRILAASMQDTKAKIGQALLPGVTGIAVAVNKYVVPALVQISEKYGPKLNDMFTRISSRMGFLMKLMVAGEWGAFAAALGPIAQKVYNLVTALQSGDSSAMGGELRGIADSGKQLAPVLGELWTGIKNMRQELPSLSDLLKVAATAIGWLADHTDELKAAIPYIVAGFVAYKLAQVAANVAAAAAVPIKLLEIVATWNQNAAIRAHTAALNANTLALGGQLAPAKVGILTKIKDAWASAQATLQLRLYAIQQRGGIQGIVKENIVRLKSIALKVKDRIVTMAQATASRISAAASTLTSVSAMRAAVVTAASTVAMKAQVLWTKIVTAAQWAWNAAMTANPIGLIVLAVVALIAILVACWFKFEGFRKVVIGAWQGIVKASVWAWENVLKPTFAAIATGAMWLWNNAIKPAFNFIMAIWRFAFTLVWGYITNIWLPAIKRMATGAMWLWNNAIKPAFNFIMAIWRFAFTLIHGFIVNIWLPAVKMMAAGAMWLWNNAIKPAFGFIVSFVRQAFSNMMMVWNSVLKPTFRAIGATAMWLWNNAVKPAIDRIRTNWQITLGILKAVWNNVLRPTFDAIGKAVGVVKDKFNTAVDGIKKIWERLKAVVHAPIKFVIEKVINEGVIGGWNWVSKNVLGGQYEIKGRVPVPKLATGGIMPGYTPGRDVHLAALSGGEAVMRPEWTRAVGPDVINAWNLAARTGGVGAVKDMLPGYAGGGIIDSVKAFGSKAWGVAKTAVRGVTDFLGDPGKYFRTLVSGALGKLDQFRGSAIGRGITAVPVKIIDNVVGEIKKLVFGANPAALGATGPVSTGSSGSVAVDAIMAMARRFYPGAMLSSGLRNTNDYHGQGLAADIIGGGASGMQTIARGFFGISNRLLELIHSGGPGFFVKHGRVVGANYYRSVIGQHYNHVHVAARRDAMVFDQGGWLQPGVTMAVNKTGRPERVLPPGADSESFTAPIVLKLDSETVYRGLLRFKRRLGGGWELA